MRATRNSSRRHTEKSRSKKLQHEEYRPHKHSSGSFNAKKTFWKIVGSIVGCFLIIVAGATAACYAVTGSLPFGSPVIDRVSDASFLDALLKRDIKMNVAVMGTDEDGTRTDVMFVVHYDSAAESIGLISIPRDTRVTVCDEVAANYEAAGRSYSSVTKLNAIHAYSSEETACQNTVLQLEDLLNISIDHYVKVDLDGFKELVDAIDGVDVYVPQDMYWDMRDTGGPLINLEEGMQHLDGDKAEQLVRFRHGYANADVGRIETQQLFLKAVLEKVISTETIVKNLADYIKIFYKYVETDISLTDALKYVNYVDKIDMDKVTMETLPGAGQYISGVSYYICDQDATRELVDQLFYTTVTDTADTDGEQTSSKGLTIEVQNGGNITGLAAAYAEKLEQSGYTVAEPANYSGTQTAQTRILVKSAGVGADLVPYFADAKVETAPSSIPDGVDICIILGTGEKMPSE